MTTSPSTSTAAGGSAASSSKKTMILILGGALVVFALIILGVFYDVSSMLPGSGPPALIEASGRVTWEGRPLGGGTVQTKPANPRHPGAVGFLDEDGNFDFRTQDAQGTYQMGIVPGKHKVAVTHYGVNYPMGAPPATPPHYADADTSPVEIVVSKSPEENRFEIEVTGEPGRRGTIDELLGLTEKTEEPEAVEDPEPEAAEESEPEAAEDAEPEEAEDSEPEEAEDSEPETTEDPELEAAEDSEPEAAESEEVE
jgi:hypothetical protein